MADASSGTKAGAAIGSIVPGVGTLLGGGIGGILGGIAGFFGGKGDRDRANQLLEEALAEISAVGAPPDLSREIILEKFKQEGMYTPELEQEVDLAVSKVAQIQEDPALRDTQLSALNLIKQRAAGGLNPEDRAAFNKIQNQVNTSTTGRNQALIQELAARGQSGAGAELAARLSANQEGSNQLSDQGMDIAATASRNALDAAARSGALAGDVRGQDFNVANTRASAEDERNRALFANSTALRSRNAAAQNEGQMANLNARQRVSDLNVNQANQEQERKANAERQYWEDKLNLATTKSNAMGGRANQLTNKANDTAGRFTSGGSAVGKLLGDAYDAYGNKKKVPL